MTKLTGLPAEKRATVRVFFVDEHLNILKSSSSAVDAGAPQIDSVPPRLRPTVLRLIRQCQADPAASHAFVFAETRVVRVVAMSGSPATYALWIERYMPHARLLSSLERFGLSSRELDVLLLALEGKTAAETAGHLNIAVSTATDYLNRLLLKTNSRNKSDLIAKVLGWQPQHFDTATWADRKGTRRRHA